MRAILFLIYLRRPIFGCNLTPLENLPAVTASLFYLGFFESAILIIEVLCNRRIAVEISIIRVLTAEVLKRLSSKGLRSLSGIRLQNHNG